jgi:hypothetical protein
MVVIEIGEQAHRLRDITSAMSHPRVLWYHLILTTYGFWLPNDPRGSWSTFVGSWELCKFGRATRTSEKRSLAHEAHDRELRLAAKRALKYPPVRFDELQRQAIADGFATAVEEGGYVVHACCVGHDYAHLVVARHERTIERIASHLKSKATMSLTRQQMHPLRDFTTRDGTIPTPWSAGIWSVFIDDRDHLNSAIRYVERHPAKEGLAPQRWTFVSSA